MEDVDNSSKNTKPGFINHVFNFDTETKNYVHGFPLRIMPWYLEFEKTRLPKPAGTLKEFV